ncbi:MAG: hypothetical protein HYU52_12405 [Acidobacteria bacterium]|nr:hypothetical protein [Acidobacteriota bacterium]
MKLRTLAFALATFLSASVAYAATFVVGSDESLIRRSSEIVRAELVSSETRMGERGLVETVYRMRVTDSLKGDAEPGTEIDVLEYGGAFENAILAVPGSPVYAKGQRYLLLLSERPGGGRMTTDLVLGQFRAEISSKGNRILIRDMTESLGWAADGSTLVEHPRLEDAFLEYVRDVVAGKRPVPAYYEDGFVGQPDDEPAASGEIAPTALDLNLQMAASVAMSQWSSAGSIAYSVSATAASGFPIGNDGEDRIVSNDPQGVVPGTFSGSGVLGVCFYGCNPCSFATVNGEQYAGITYADVVINDGVSSANLSQGNLNSTVTHEVGHSLGFRHSDKQKNNDGATCGSPLPCSSSAIMRASLLSGLNGTLQLWDSQGANEVYGNGTATAFTGSQFVNDFDFGGSTGLKPARRTSNSVAWRIYAPVACIPASVSSHPQSTSIDSGSSAELNVIATGTGPFNYEWFRGESGVTTSPVGTNSSSFNTGALNQTTKFWVRVRNCNNANSVNSNTATITVQPSCPANALCALGGRFQLSLAVRDHRTGKTGSGTPLQQNDLFGFYSLPTFTGDASNPEVFVKMLDGRAFNGNFWTFFGGLTDLEYTLMVKDTQTGGTKNYFRAGGSSAGGFDVGSGVTPETCAGEVDGASLANQSPSVCLAQADRLCLSNGRFRVTLTARDPRTGATGPGQSIPQSAIFGYFAIPALTGNPSNPEVFVKVIDARGFNGFFWIFFSGLTDFEYTITVTDTVTGKRKSYTKAAGSACGAFDTNAFTGQ